MLLDNRTLVFSLMLVGAMMALSLAVVSWGREHDSLKKWAGAMALEAVAFFLIGVRGAIPDVVSIIFPIILMVTAQALKLAAIYEYRELALPRWQCLVPVGLVAMIIASLPPDDFRGQLIYGSLIYAAQMLMILKILRTDMDSRAGRAWWLLFGPTLASEAIQSDITSLTAKAANFLVAVPRDRWKVEGWAAHSLQHLLS